MDSALRFMSATDSELVRRAAGLLEVDPAATPDEIKRAYRAKAKRYHPDLHDGDAGAAEVMIRLNQARDWLRTLQPA